MYHSTSTNTEDLMILCEYISCFPVLCLLGHWFFSILFLSRCDFVFSKKTSSILSALNSCREFLSIHAIDWSTISNIQMFSLDSSFELIHDNLAFTIFTDVIGSQLNILTNSSDQHQLNGLKSVLFLDSWSYSMELT
jgi:hypothetical protein